MGDLRLRNTSCEEITFRLTETLVSGSKNTSIWESSTIHPLVSMAWTFTLCLAVQECGLNSDMQWSVYNFPLDELREYDTFKPTPYFMKTYVPFFSQYSQVYNPWAPDSRSFIYITNNGLHHTPLVGSKYTLG